ncbi:MAG: LamG domain-containing protein [Planctomycetota bacterium]|jgi:hypothetical protein
MCGKVILSTVLIAVLGIVGAASAAILDLKVDIGTTERDPNYVKPGWTGWSEPRRDPGPVRADETFGDITVILEVETLGFPNVGLAFRDPYDGPPLVGDGVMIDNWTVPHVGEIHMTIVGLAAGDYTMTTWHNYTFDWPSEFVDIEVDGGLKMDDVMPTKLVATDEEATTATFDFTAPGDVNVVITFRSEQPERNIPLNGFHLVSHATARNPNPADDYQNMCPDGSLSWTAGEFAQAVNGHDVYFGADFDDVNDATTSVDPQGVYRGRQSTTEYDPPGTLVMGNTYYWRIDEVNDTDGNSPLKGTVWSFKVNEGQAFNPTPTDGADLVPADTLLNWSGCAAVSYDVYFGADSNDVNDATSGSHPNVDYNNVAVDFLDPGDLEEETTYYWRVDVVGDGNFWPGDVWEFTTGIPILDPNLILWYEFDETTGDRVGDSSGYGHHGVADDFEEDTWDPNDGQYPGCINFNGGQRIDVPWSTLKDLAGQITITVWVKGAMGDENYVLSAGDDSNNVWALIPTTDGANVEWRAGNDTDDVLVWREAEPSAWADDWRHFAFVKDEDAGTMSIYFDGVLATSRTDTSNTLAFVGNKWFKIGAKWDDNDGIAGKMDDLRIYDRVLSPTEIASLFRGGNLDIAWAPSPRDGAKDVGRDVVLKWRPGDNAISHQLYMGTNWDDVNDADTLSGAYVGPFGPNEYDPGGLDMGATWYWRIDEVNGPNTWKGKVWRFSVANFLIVDDMQSYNAIPGSGNEIYDTWDDGFNNWTGSQVALEYGSEATVHGGSQAMKLQYNNVFGYYKYSEVDANTTGPRPGNLAIGVDWTSFDVKALTLFFYGQAGNDANEQMYVALEDGSSNIAIAKYGDLGEDMNDVREPQWHEWNIAMSSFSDAGATITDIAKVRIGFGDRENPVIGGSGEVFFDDIRLYLPKCVPWIVKPAVDISNNCIVDFEDIEMLAGDWLEYGYGTVTAATPDGSKLRLQYLFDDAGGTSTVADNTTPEYDGTFFVDVNQTPGNISTRLDPDGKSGTSFHFSAPLGAAGISMPNDVFVDAGISQEITVCMWVKNVHPDETPDGGAFMWEFRQWDGNSTEAGDRVLAVEADDTGDSYGLRDDGDSVWYEHEWDDHTEWQHYAFVRDAATLKIYVDGILESEDNSSGNPMATPGLLYLGVSADRAPENPDGLHDGFTGNIDDFRIYSYALSYGQVVSLAEQALIYDAVDSEANVYEPGEEEIIDFKDFAVITDSWLEEILWPE